MTSKERAALISRAMTLEPILSVGKGGVTPELIQNVDEALKARELIKMSIQKTCFEPVRDIAVLVAERSRSELVQVIGRRFVLYRYSKDLKKHISLEKGTK